MYTPRQNPADLQLLNGYNLRCFIVDYANHCDDLQQAMVDAKGSIVLNPVIRTRDWGSDLVEDSTSTTKKYHEDMQKIYDNICDLCNATQTVIEQFIHQSQCQVALLVLKRAELVDLTMKNISEQKASMMTPQRMGELGKELGKAPVKKKQKLHQRRTGKPMKPDLTPANTPTETVVKPAVLSDINVLK